MRNFLCLFVLLLAISQSRAQIVEPSFFEPQPALSSNRSDSQEDLLQDKEERAGVGEGWPWAGRLKRGEGLSWESGLVASFLADLERHFPINLKAEGAAPGSHLLPVFGFAVLSTARGTQPPADPPKPGQQRSLEEGASSWWRTKRGEQPPKSGGGVASSFLAKLDKQFRIQLRPEDGSTGARLLPVFGFTVVSSGIGDNRTKANDNQGKPGGGVCSSPGPGPVSSAKSSLVSDAARKASAVKCVNVIDQELPPNPAPLVFHPPPAPVDLFPASLEEASRTPPLMPGLWPQMYRVLDHRRPQVLLQRVRRDHCGAERLEGGGEKVGLQSGQTQEPGGFQ